MGKSKPVLKRSIPRSSSRSSHRSAFIFAVVLVAILGWSLYHTATKNPKPPTQSAENRIEKQPSKPVPGREAKIAPVPRLAVSQKHPLPPENIVFEKDSMTYPGPAPRVETKLPQQPKLSVGPIDWSKPAIAFVIDDIGHEITYDAVVEHLGPRITYAILPHLRYSFFYAEKSKRTGADVILHLPLESELGIYPGPGLITGGMPDDAIRILLRENLASVPNHIGVNNHMGSLGTSDSRLMKIILSEIHQRNLFFLDSFTSLRSQVVPLSHTLGVPVLRRDVFLDNVEDAEAVRKQINQTAQVAQKSGYAIAIGHYKKHTLEVIAEEIPKLERQGFQIVKLSDMIKHYAQH